MLNDYTLQLIPMISRVTVSLGAVYFPNLNGSSLAIWPFIITVPSPDMT